jgi:excisionase family DNA binding protein
MARPTHEQSQPRTNPRRRSYKDRLTKMKSRPTQFGVRENTASSRQHASCLAGNSSPELVGKFKSPHDGAKASSPPLRGQEVFDLPLTSAAKEATGKKGEETIASLTAKFANAERVKMCARPTDFEALLDVAEAARLLRMHPRTLRTKARKRIIPAVQVGRRWRFRASTLNDWLEKLAS